MADQVKASPQFDLLYEQLRKQKSVKELMEHAQSPTFIGEAGKLDERELNQLRDAFASFRIALSGQVKMEELSGEEITVERAIYRRTEVDGKSGDAYSLIGKRADGTKFQTITSATAVVRFWDNHNDRCPIQVVMDKEPHPDPDRARKGHSIWRIREKREGSQARIPF